MKFIYQLGLAGTERKTFRMHLAYAIIDGIIMGVLVINEYIFLKSMHGSKYLMSILFTFSMIIFLFSTVFNEFLIQVKNIKRTLRIIALISRVPLVIVALFPRDMHDCSGCMYHYLFLTVFLLYYLATPAVLPFINLFLKKNYPAHRFGKLYSYAVTVRMLTLMITTFLTGRLLDIFPGAYVYIFPALGVLGFLGIYFLTLIDYKEEALKKRLSTVRTFFGSFGNIIRIYRNNRPFLHFEIGFMLYGFAFMSTMTVINVFFEQSLGLSYTSVAFYKNVANIFPIVLLPVLGSFISKVDPRRFAAFAFSCLFLHILFLIFTSRFHASVEIYDIQVITTLLIAYVFFGLFQAAIFLTWNIGSSFFCTSGEAGSYQSVHLTMTGVRAVFAPLLGIVFSDLLGYVPAFIIAMTSLSAGIFIMIWSQRKYRLPEQGEVNIKNQ